ncbi:extracellular sensory domain-containing protein [Haloferula helveola]|uniref:Extracellular sensory domain-containing protein n=1 Tax=Haloferula helveola TaxID=490095 RepID=A0ABM7RBK9_9BACT|nr:extracellular sensory domain-containing protein [Haloferula helveola]
MAKPRWNRRLKRAGAAAVISLIALAWGLMLLEFDFGVGLRRASYDLPFRFTERVPPDDIVLIQLDEATFADFQLPLTEPLDRRFHAEMVKLLTEAGARMIIFDISFPDSKPEQDEAFADAMEKHGNVVLIGELVKIRNESAERERLLLSTPVLRQAAAGWGLSLVPRDTDDVIRRIRPMIETPFGPKPSLSEIVRQLDSGSREAAAESEWFLDYYGRAGTFPSYSFSGVARGSGIDEGAFQDKIIIIGARQNADGFGAGKDLFTTPYTVIPVENRDTGELEKVLTPGMEIQATAIANLLEGRRITRLDSGIERWLIILLPFLFSGAACLLAPIRGGVTCLCLAAVVAALGVLGQQMQGWNFLWTIPAFGQAPLVIGLALGAHYFIEYSARWKLRRAFRSYMSEEQARQIDDDEVSLELGGKEVEATVLFSDLQGFTAMSEGLPPQAVSKALISYFERATEGILDNEGTIIKYVGDAVMATWGAPLKVDREADRAIDAAIQMQVASSKPITLETGEGTIEKVLATRVGINAGPGLAGNLGSKRRFDYSVIGDTTNTAARLEGLNKMLGTSVLVSEAVLAKCADRDRFATRRMGSFVLKGKRQGIVVHEVLGYRDDPANRIRKRDETYLVLYRQAVEAFEAGDFERARGTFEKTRSLHDLLPDDPASVLFLRAIDAAGTGAEWRGEVILESK